MLESSPEMAAARSVRPFLPPGQVGVAPVPRDVIAPPLSEHPILRHRAQLTALSEPLPARWLPAIEQLREVLAA